MADVIVMLKGGLGNQLFQYAFARSLQLRYGYDSIILDIADVDGHVGRPYDLNNFSLPYDIVRTCSDNRYACYSRRRNLFLRCMMRICPGVAFKWGRKKNCFHWDFDRYVSIDNFIETNRDIVINGYWQSEKYFQSISGVVKSEFLMRDTDSLLKNEYYKEITDSNSTCVHVRLGDYQGLKLYSTYGIEYYREAIRLILKKTDTTFFVFSDDIKGAKALLSDEFPLLKYVSYDNQSGISDFFLMSQCNNFIMANSTFSWWAQYLGKKKDIVIAPKSGPVKMKVRIFIRIIGYWCNMYFVTFP